MPHSDLSPEEQKQLFREALREWLDDQFSAFGKWTAAGILAAGFAGAVWLTMIGMGWHR